MLPSDEVRPPTECSVKLTSLPKGLSFRSESLLVGARGTTTRNDNAGAVERGDLAGHVRQRRPSAGLSGGTEATAGSASPHRISGYRGGARSDVPQRPQPRVGRNQRCGPYVSSRGTPKPGDRSLQRGGSKKWVLRVECGERTVGALHKARLQGRTRKQDHFDDRHARRAARG